ncbi:MAG TPA: hypothetical protein VMA83_09000 [Solirubrobacteraceae bacterium]|nr:hypothetical protein [Solirubrobacteraceae bacterium]
MSEPSGHPSETEAYEEVDGVPVLPRRHPIASRLRALPARPAISAAAGGLVVGAAAVGLLQRRTASRRALAAPSRRRALPSPSRRRALKASQQPLEVTRVVMTRSVQVTLVPAGRGR